MKKKYEDIIFPSSPDILLFFHIFKFVLIKYQNEILFTPRYILYMTRPDSILGRK
ncbi:Uncharacterised protein [uncultured archaeon]|nr:Uncharacterised protein [uncultured archaeon]